MQAELGLLITLPWAGRLVSFLCQESLHRFVPFSLREHGRKADGAYIAFGAPLTEFEQREMYCRFAGMTDVT